MIATTLAATRALTVLRTLELVAPEEAAPTAPEAQPELRATPRALHTRESARLRAGADPIALQLRARAERESKLPEATQRIADEILARHPDDRRARRTIGRMIESPGFKALTESEQAKLLEYVGGTNTQMSAPARAAMKELLESGRYKNASAAEQAAMLRQFMTEQPGNVPAATNVPYDVDSKRRPYTISKGTEVPGYEFKSGKADAIRYDVVIDGRTIPVYMPKNPDPNAGHTHSIEEIARALAAVPPKNLALINEVRVNPGPNPDDAEWARRHNDPNRRGYMTAGDGGVMSIYPTEHPVPDSSITTTMIHESGHFIAAKVLGPEGDPRWAEWERAMASDGFSPSAYAEHSANEDLAEALAFYEQVRGTPQESELRRLMPARFALLDKYFGRG